MSKRIYLVDGISFSITNFDVDKQSYMTTDLYVYAQKNNYDKYIKNKNDYRDILTSIYRIYLEQMTYNLYKIYDKYIYGNTLLIDDNIDPTFYKGVLDDWKNIHTLTYNDYENIVSGRASFGTIAGYTRDTFLGFSSVKQSSITQMKAFLYDVMTSNIEENNQYLDEIEKTELFRIIDGYFEIKHGIYLVPE